MPRHIIRPVKQWCGYKCKYYTSLRSMYGLTLHCTPYWNMQMYQVDNRSVPYNYGHVPRTLANAHKLYAILLKWLSGAHVLYLSSAQALGLITCTELYFRSDMLSCCYMKKRVFLEEACLFGNKFALLRQV